MFPITAAELDLGGVAVPDGVEVVVLDAKDVI
jgi:hypothetical protein